MKLDLMILDDVCEFMNGGAWSDKEYVSDGIPVVKVTNMVNGTITSDVLSFLPNSSFYKYKKHKLHRGDLVVTTVGSHPTQPGSVVGRTAVVPKEFEGALLNQNAVCIRVKRKDLISPEFLRYLSKTVHFKHHIESRARGSANQVRMAIGELRKFSFKYPQLVIQQKIAAILSAYDDLIENNNKRIALLEKAAEEIYREWFVRMRFAGHEKEKFRKGIPQSWEIKKASHYFGYVKGKSYLGDEINEYGEGMPFINLKSINRGGGYRRDGIKYYTGVYKENQIVYPNDVVMALTDMTQNREIVGRAARIPNDFEKYTISLDIQKLTPKNISKTFLYAYLKYSGFGNLVKEFANGANVLHLSSEVVAKQDVLIPSEPLRIKFDALYEPMLKELDILGANNYALVKSRDLLLSRLISGKLSVEGLDVRMPMGMAVSESAGRVSSG